MGKEYTAKRELEARGFSRNKPWADLWAAALAVGLLTCIISYLTFYCKCIVTASWTQAFTAGLSLSVAVIVYRQWYSVRNEISIDKYYDRLDSVNKRLETQYKEDQNHPYTLYVFAELDKLEYVSMKYKLRFIPVIIAHRALTNFERLCKDKGDQKFNTEAYRWVHKASYTESFRKVVENICLRHDPTLEPYEDGS